MSTKTAGPPSRPSAAGLLAVRVVVLLGAATGAFGVVVMVACIERWTPVLRPAPGAWPIAFDTGLGLALTGATVAGLALGRALWVMVAGCYDLVVGGLTILEHLTGRDLGIDQLFVGAYLAPPGDAAGRIAPKEAVCWVLIGAGILGSAPWPRRGRPWLPTVSGATVTALAVVTLFGYAAGLPSANDWGHLTGMPVAAACGLAGLGLALMILGWAAAREASEGLHWWLLPTSLVTLILDVSLLLAVVGERGRTRAMPEGVVTAATLIGVLLAVVVVIAVWLNQQAGARAKALGELAEDQRRSEARYRGMVLALGEGIVVQDGDGRIVECNAAAERLLGLSRDELLGVASADPRWHALHEDGSPFPGETHPGMVTLRTGQPCRDVVMRVRTDLREDRWLLINTQPLTGSGTEAPYGVVASFTDITEVHRAQEELAHRALHDDLTGLPNRALLLEHLTRALARGRRTGLGVGVLFLDLDDFKAINDSYGHSAGDEYLARVAARIGTGIRASDLAARVGGDEFVVVCENLAGPADAARVAEQVQCVLDTAIPLRGQQVAAGASIGIAVSTPDSTPETLLRDADAAMYVAKHRGGRGWETADESLHAAATRVLTVEAGLRQALQRREFSLYYQPIVHLEDGAIVATEALLRWRHPEHGLTLPEHFIDVAEQRGLIGEIGTWALHTACAQAVDWRRHHGEAAPGVAVNVSSRQLNDLNLTRQIHDLLDRTRLPPDRLCLEITESQLLTASARSTADLATLCEDGVRVAVDDFGTGHAGFDYLRRLPVNELKIDRSFINGTGTDPTDTAVTAAVVTLGLNLGLTVVAEGIETRQQLRTLRDMGCTRGQGWLWHQALPPEDLDAILARPRPHTRTAIPVGDRVPPEGLHGPGRQRG
ncbi:MAG TPA: EAL domain-containing protein [Kineosporiaceae bacterium]|nr:EAL domain-containing protein [Kineosporiaceae bacterium]